MATDQDQRPFHAEANQEPPSVAVPTKPGVAASDPPEEKLPGTEIPAANAIVFRNDVSHRKSRVSDFHEDEIPIDGGYLETESLESSASSTPRDDMARQERMEVEANAYLESETRKVNARAHAAQAMAEKRKMHEEAKALELKKRAELRAEQLQCNAEAKADKIMCKAKEDTFKVAVKADKIVENATHEAVKLKAHVYEQTERSLADATAKAERDKAAEEEARRIGIAELVDEVEQMKTTGELPVHEKKGMITRLKEKVVGHHI